MHIVNEVGHIIVEGVGLVQRARALLLEAPASAARAGASSQPKSERGRGAELREDAVLALLLARCARRGSRSRSRSHTSASAWGRAHSRAAAPSPSLRSGCSGRGVRGGWRGARSICTCVRVRTGRAAGDRSRTARTRCGTSR